MTRPDTIGPTQGARAARAQRACERWAENGGDLAGAPLEAVARAVVAKADELRRDLDVAEVERECVAAVASWRHEDEQRRAREALAGAREEERLAYLRKRAAEYRTRAGR